MPNLVNWLPELCHCLFRRLKLPKGASLHSLRHTHTSHLLASRLLKKSKTRLAADKRG
jgi:hypothetical protein